MRPFIDRIGHVRRVPPLPVFFLSLALCLAAPLARAQTTLNLAANEKALEQAVAALLIKDIYANAGLTASIEPLPGKRATKLALEGSKDGETARITAYATMDPPLLRVDPPFYYLTTGVFAKVGRNLVITSKADLTKLRVGVVRGIVHAERAVEARKDVEVVDKYEQLYRMIDAGRIDVGIDTGINGRAEIAALKLTGRVEHVGDIATHDLHNMLNPRHAALVPKIGATIKGLQSSGKLTQLTQKYEKQVIDSWAHQH